MTEEGLKLESDLCRCCQAEGRFKSLYESPNGEESFAEMLKIALDIELKPVNDTLDRKMFAICETCIRRLQDADNFKQQVLGCERVFQQLYIGELIKVANKIKPVIKGTTITIKDESSDDDYSLRDLIDIQETGDEPDNDGPDNDKPENTDQELVVGMTSIPVITPEAEDEESDTRQSKSMLQTILVEPMRRSGRKKTTPRKQAAPAGKKLKPKPSPKKKKPATLDEKVKNVMEKKKKGAGDADRETSQSRRNVYRLQETDYMTLNEGIKCLHCGKILNTMNTLRFHIKTQHLKMGKYNCELCNESFTTAAPFTRHKYEIHSIDDRVQCNACEHVFNSKVQLTKHIKSFHMLGQIHKCQYCDYECYSVESLYKHNFKHKTVKDYHCKYCKKSFLRKTTLDIHERIHTGDRRKVCKECGQAFVQKASLNYHMAKYHPEVNF